MRILVTGSEGHIGKQLVKRLLQLDHQVLRMDIIQLYQENYIMCAITNLGDAYSKIDKFKPQIIYHLAAAVSRVTSQQAPFNALYTNICGTLNIVQLAIKYKAKLINFSTSQIYGNAEFNDDHVEIEKYKPVNIYGLSKWMGQIIAKYYSNIITIINIRPHMIYDSEEKMLDNRSALIRFVKSALLGQDIIVHKDSFRGWLYISDAIELIIRTMNIHQSISINIGNQDIRSMESLAQLIIQEVGNFDKISNIIIQELPQKICKNKIPNLQKQKILLKYEPKVTIEEGIKKVIASARIRLNEK